MRVVCNLPDAGADQPRIAWAQQGKAGVLQTGKFECIIFDALYLISGFTH
jgi:hypothetical protein